MTWPTSSSETNAVKGPNAGKDNGQGNGLGDGQQSRADNGLGDGQQSEQDNGPDAEQQSEPGHGLGDGLSHEQRPAQSKRRSFPNRAMLFLNLKRFLWLPALHFLLLFLAVPLRIAAQGPDNVLRYWQLLNTVSPQIAASYIADWFDLFSSGNPFVTFLGVAAALLWAAVMFNYLNEGKAVAFFHSLTFSRKSLFLNLTLVCFIGLALPVLAVSLCCLLLRLYAGIGILYGSLAPLAWFLSHCLLIAVIFSAAVLAGMITGLPLIQTVFTFIFHLLPLALYGMVSYTLHRLIYGFPITDNGILEGLLDLPFTRVFLDLSGASAGEYLFLVASVALFLVLALWLYRRRPLENSGDIIVFPILKPWFKYGVAFCASLTGAAIMETILDTWPRWWMLLLWGLIGYAAAEMLLQKSIRIAKAWKGAAIYSLALLLALGCIHFDLLGYEGRIPEAARVEAVLMPQTDENGYRAFQLLRILESRGQRILPQLAELLGPFAGIAEDEEGIAAAMAIHRRLIESKGQDQRQYNDQSLTYMLDGNRIMRRQYDIDYQEFIEESRILFEHQIKKRQSHHLHYALPQDIAWMSVRSEIAIDTATPSLNQEEMAGLLQALQQDLLDRKYETAEGDHSPLFTVEYAYAQPQIDWRELRRLDPEIFDSGQESLLKRYVSPSEVQSSGYNRYDFDYLTERVYADYRHTLAWLARNNYMEKLLPEAGEVARIRLYFAYNVDCSFQKYPYWLQENALQPEMPAAYPSDYGNPAPDSFNSIGEIDYPYVYITDSAFIRQILLEGGWEPYCRPVGEVEWDRQIYQIELLGANGRPILFHGYYYNGLPGFLTELAEVLNARS